MRHVLTFALLLAAAAPVAADPATVIADCKTGITSSSAGGIAIRAITGGAIPGMQAYVHELPSTNSKTKTATLVGAVDVKYGIKPHNNTVEMVLVNDGSPNTFQLSISKTATAGGERKATLVKGEVGGKKLDGQELVCTLATPAGAGGATECDAPKPAACPGGGAPSCNAGKWECAPLPKGCDAAAKPAACPGGGGPSCTDGKWACAPLPQKK